MNDSAILSIQPLGFPWQTSDPFLFCVHHEDFYPEGNEQLGPKTGMDNRPLGNDFQVRNGYRMYHGKTVPGFPAHPHRGFETVTIARQGLIDHSDSLGAAGRFGFGDVQWMTAGKGVQHSEMFPLLHPDKPNTMELFQIWLNLPQKSKMVEPHFKMLWHEDIPVHNEEGTEVTVIAGTFKDTSPLSPTPDSWAATNEHEVGIWTIKMDPNSKLTLPKASDGVNRTLYFFKGDELLVAGTNIPNYNSAVLDPTQDNIIESGSTAVDLLILQGKPIDEKVVQHGPFVMNSEEEIYQAFDEYQRTQFGGWPWGSHDHVHDKDKGRFALYPDGTLVNK